MNISSEEVEVEQAIAFLTWKQETRDSIDLAVPGPHSVFMPCGTSRFFVDYAWIIQRLYRLFLRLKVSDQNFKGVALEELVRRGNSALPIGECRAMDDSRKQIDAAFDLGEGLLVVECKVKGKSIAWERGWPEAIRQRQDFVSEALRQADDKAAWLASHPIGRNYNVSKYNWILGVAVSPFAEFVWSQDSYFWLTSSLPRILTPGELHSSLDDGSLQHLCCHHQMSARVKHME